MTPPYPTGAADLWSRVALLGLEAKVALLTGADAWSVSAEPVVGLRRLVLADGPAGVRGEHWDDRYPSANIPSPTALAATWDVDLVRRLGGLLAAEARRKGVDVVLAPTVNLHRTPAGGRHFECFSEDPVLTGEIGRAYVDGLQAGGVAACVKHFVGNDQESQRMTVDIVVDERTLRELYLAPFERICTDGGAWSVMAAYNKVNGVTMTEHPILSDLVKGEWGYDGLVVSDWFACRSVVPAAGGGLDVAMPGPHSPWGADLVEAVRAGLVREEVIDDKVGRLLRLAGRVGALAPEPRHPEPLAVPADDLAREAAAASFVLVKNDNVLPLSGPPAPHRLAVIGPNAARGRTQGGGSATVFPESVVHPVDGLAAALPATAIRSAIGVRSGDRAPILDASTCTLPDGSAPGLLVEFLGDDDVVLASQHNGVANVNWVNGFDVVDDPESVRALRARCRYRAGAGGTHRLGGSAVGTVTVTVGAPTRGQTRTADLSLADGADAVEALTAPPQLLLDRDLMAGEAVDLTVTVVPARAPDTGATLWAIQLNALPPYPGDEAAIAEAARLAADSDAAVVVVGTTEEVESEGYDRADLALPGRQDDLVRAVLAANPRTVVVVNAGAPVLMPWLDDAPAVLLTWFGGQQLGAALADVLTGAVEPGGRMPTTWGASGAVIAPPNVPQDGCLRYDEGLHVGYRAYLRDGVTPAVSFGHGLGYTTWAISDTHAHTYAVTLTVTNSGARPGKHVVQVYLSRPDSTIDRPALWLAAFATVRLDAGHSRELTIDIPRSAYRHWDVGSGSWEIESGTFLAHVGSSVADLEPAIELRLPRTTAAAGVD